MSYRNDTNATYDRTLLDSVPDPTRAERQEGYNVDLLDGGRDRRAPTPPAPERRPTDQQPLTDGYSPGAVALAHKEGLENGARPAAAKVAWYRTRWGITAIVIVIVLVIGAIVGGVVGGTHHSSHKNNGNGVVGSGNTNGSSSIISGNSPGSSIITGNNPGSGIITGNSPGSTSVNPESFVTPTSSSSLDPNPTTPNPNAGPQPSNTGAAPPSRQTLKGQPPL